MSSARLRPKTAPMGGSRAWMIWLTGSLYVIYQFCLQVSFAIFGSEMRAYLSLSASDLALLAAAFPLGYGLMQIPAGILLDRIGPRWTMTSCVLVCVIGVVLFGSATDLPMAMAGRVLMSVGAAAGFIGTTLLASRWFPPSRFALFVGLTEMLGMAGAASCDTLFGYLADVYSWRMLMHAAAMIGVALFIALGIVIRDWPSGGPPRDVTRPEPVTTSLRQIGSLAPFWLIVGFYSLSFGTLLGFAGLWNVPFQLSFNLSLNDIAPATALIFIGWGAGSVVAGWASDRLGRRKPLLVLSLAGQFVVLCLILFTPLLPLPVIWAFRLSLGFFGGMNVIAFAALCDRVPLNQRGTAMGALNTAGSLGVGALQFLPSLFIDPERIATTPDLEWALSLYLVALVIAAGCLARLREEKQPRDEHHPTHSEG